MPIQNAVSYKFLGVLCGKFSFSVVPLAAWATTLNRIMPICCKVNLLEGFVSKHIISRHHCISLFFTMVRGIRTVMAAKAASQARSARIDQVTLPSTMGRMASTAW